MIQNFGPQSLKRLWTCQSLICLSHLNAVSLFLYLHIPKNEQMRDFCPSTKLAVGPPKLTALQTKTLWKTRCITLLLCFGGCLFAFHGSPVYMQFFIWLRNSVVAEPTVQSVQDIPTLHLYKRREVNSQTRIRKASGNKRWLQMFQQLVIL